MTPQAKRLLRCLVSLQEASVDGRGQLAYIGLRELAAAAGRDWLRGVARDLDRMFLDHWIDLTFRGDERFVAHLYPPDVTLRLLEREGRRDFTHQ